jgi:hypothetical protein
MFYIPALTYAFSENTGDTVKHSRRAIDYVRSHFPFFNRCASCAATYVAAQCALGWALCFRGRAPA